MPEYNIEPFRETSFNNKNSNIFTTQNIGDTALNDVNIFFKFPENTVIGSIANTSSDIWRGYCNGGEHCYTWIINALPLSTTATADIPIFIIDVSKAVVLSAKLISSMPIDSVKSNNEARVNVTKTLETPRYLKLQKGKFQIIVIQKISSNLTDSGIRLELNSSETLSATFSFYNTHGNNVIIETHQLEKGYNHLEFNCDDLQSGVYYILL